jgi:3-oxoacyl-[acyl-carrier protein] reductase
MTNQTPELAGRVALVTGAGRRIGCAIAARLLAAGASVMLHSWTPHDAEQPWGADPAGPNAVLDTLGGPGSRLDHVAVDLADPDTPAELIDRTIARFGALDILVINHARSGVVAWLTSTDSQPITGQIINAEAGFRRGT